MKFKIFSLLVFIFLFATIPLFAQNEQLTITTYYPSPYGSYSELTTSGNTHLATASGNVGIGTTSPVAKLQVMGNNGGLPLLASNQSSIIIQNAYTTAGNTGPALQFKSDTRGNNTFAAIAGNMLGANASGAYGDLIFGTKPLATDTDLAERMRINYVGNVGIGTNNPQNILSIQSVTPNAVYLKGNTGATTPWTAALFVAESNIDYRGRGLFLPSTAAEASDSWFVGVPYAGSGFQIGNSSTHTMQNATGPWMVANAKFFITPAGNVGIGTPTPGGKLEISGAASTRQYITSTGNNQAWIQFIVNGGDSSYIGPSVNNGLLFNITDGDFAMRVHGALQISTNDNGTPYVTVTTDAKVGIGTVTPAAKLEVNGGVKVGADGRVCDASIYGTIRLSSNRLQGCDSTGWQNLTP